MIVFCDIFFGETFNVISVKATKVPKDPLTSLDKS